MWTTGKKLMFGAALAIINIAPIAHAQTIYTGEDRNITQGMNALKKGDLEAASKQFHLAARKDLGEARLLPLLNNLCAVEYALGSLDSAEKACSRAIAEDRHYWRAYVNRGNVMRAKGDLVQAHADYAKAVRLKPKNKMTQSALARLLEEQPKLFASVK